jgi:type IV pilus assembly protein PilV
MQKTESGFTLLEVLIAVLVLTFGLLGIAGLLLTTVQNNSVASQRTIATFLAQDMADRMRLNVNAFRDGADSGAYATAPVARNCFGTSPAPGCATARGVAERDLAVWRAQLRDPKGGLPGGEGVVCQTFLPDQGSSVADARCDNNVDAPWVIKIFWASRAEDQSDAGTPKTQRFVMIVGGL